MAFTPFVESDLPTMPAFNQKFLDAIQQATEDAVAEAAQIATGTYVGTGTSGLENLNMITFPEGFVPQLVIIQAISGGATAGLLVLPVKDDNTSAYVPSTGSSSGGSAPWNVYGVTSSFNHQYNRIGWYANNGGADNQLNVSGATYKWIAIR